MNGSHYTSHGKMRVKERLENVNKSEVLKMIDGNKYVNLFTVPGMHKQYLLIYIPQLDTHWVVVYCSQVLSIITILPIRYYNRLHPNRPITDEEFQKAKEFNETSTPKFRVRLVYSVETDNGTRRASKELWKGVVPELFGDAARLMDNEKIRKQVVSQCDKLAKLSRADESMSKAVPLYIDITYGRKSEITSRETIYLT